MLKAKPSDVVRTSTGFHRHNTGSQALQKTQQAVPLKPLA